MKGRRTENAFIDKSGVRGGLQIAPHRSDPVTGPGTATAHRDPCLPPSHECRPATQPQAFPIQRQDIAFVNPVIHEGIGLRPAQQDRIPARHLEAAKSMRQVVLLHGIEVGWPVHASEQRNKGRGVHRVGKRGHHAKLADRIGDPEDFLAVGQDNPQVDIGRQHGTGILEGRIDAQRLARHKTILIEIQGDTRRLL